MGSSLTPNKKICPLLKKERAATKYETQQFALKRFEKSRSGI
jgi:hypothetical protein